MKRSAMRFLIVLVTVASLFAGCKGRENATGDAATETIAPAPAQPQPTGTEAMTQTVDIEGGRSEAEGAALTDTRTPPPAASSTVAPAATTTTTTTATTTTPTTTR